MLRKKVSPFPCIQIIGPELKLPHKQLGQNITLFSSSFLQSSIRHHTHNALAYNCCILVSSNNNISREREIHGYISVWFCSQSDNELPHQLRRTPIISLALTGIFCEYLLYKLAFYCKHARHEHHVLQSE